MKRMVTLKQDTSRYRQHQAINDFSAVSGTARVRPSYGMSRVAATVAAARKTSAEDWKVAGAEDDGDGARAVASLPVPAGDAAEGVDDDGDSPKNGAPDDGAGALKQRNNVSTKKFPSFY